MRVRYSGLCILFKILFLIYLGLVAPLACAEITLEEVPEQTSDELLQALRAGGFVIYMRHAATEHTEIDQDLRNIQDCATQRNLSAQGRQQARQFGDVIRSLGVPIGKVESSPYCRCRETAQLAFGNFKINPVLYFSIAAGPEETEEKAMKLRTLLLTKPAPGTNNFLISHTSNLKEAIGIWPAPEGVSVIFRPLGGGRIAYYGMMTIEQWLELGRFEIKMP